MEIAGQDYPCMKNNTKPCFTLHGDQFLGSIKVEGVRWF